MLMLRVAEKTESWPPTDFHAVYHQPPPRVIDNFGAPLFLYISLYAQLKFLHLHSHSLTEFVIQFLQWLQTLKK